MKHRVQFGKHMLEHSTCEMVFVVCAHRYNQDLNTGLSTVLQNTCHNVVDPTGCEE